MKRKQTRLSTAVVGPIAGFFLGYLFCLFSHGEKPSKFSSSFLAGRFLSKEDESVVEAEEMEGDKEVDPKIVSTTVASVVIILIILTIAFEEMKEYVEEKANRNMRPIIEKLFGEMTVLGFLSVFTFLVTKMGFFDEISMFLFGEEEKLEEIFEFVHYILFFIMFFFVVQVLLLVRDAMDTEQDWLEMDRKSRDKRYMMSLVKSRKSDGPTIVKQTNPWWDYIVLFNSLLPHNRNYAREHDEDQIVFAALREEFIKERSFEPPYHPLEEDQRLSDDFNFGRYLSMCLGKVLTHVVEVDVFTWAFFGAFTVLFYIVELVTNENLVILGWIWVALGWVGWIFNVHFEHHFYLIRFALLPSCVEQKSCEMLKHFSCIEKKPKNESSRLLEKEESRLADDDDLPNWCKVDLEKYMANRNWLKRLVNGPACPPRQHSLFWFERKGAKASVLILQLNLLGLGIYCAVLFLAFVPAVIEHCEIISFLVYLILSLVPVMIIMLNKQHLVAVMSQVLCVGPLRHPRAVADVIREEKTAQIVRSFFILFNLHRTAQLGFKPKTREATRKPHREVFDIHQLQDLRKTFDSFDKSGDGHICANEFRGIMSALGVSLSNEQLRNMISSLDIDGDGKVSEDEFLQWYADQIGEDELSVHERARFFFKMFDQDGSGEISVGEFKSTLDAFNISFTVDEVGELVKEMDEDGSGTIGEEEFEELLEKYYPNELRYSDYHMTTQKKQTNLLE